MPQTQQTACRDDNIKTSSSTRKHNLLVNYYLEQHTASVLLDMEDIVVL